MRARSSPGPRDSLWLIYRLDNLRQVWYTSITLDAGWTGVRFQHGLISHTTRVRIPLPPLRYHLPAFAVGGRGRKEQDFLPGALWVCSTVLAGPIPSSGRGRVVWEPGCIPAPSPHYSSEATAGLSRLTVNQVFHRFDSCRESTFHLKCELAR